MAIRSGTPAPYGPPAGVMAVINGFRDRGLATPFTSDVLLRAGVSESLVPRVLQSLKGLDLIDEDGHPTPQMEGLRRAPSEEFKKRLEEVVRAAYAEVFQFTDPATDDATRVADAFRAYQPAGQRARMVTLFLGLCEAAGIIPSGTTASRAISAVRPMSKNAAAPTARRPATFSTQARIRSDDGNGMIPAPLSGLLASLPAEGSGWTEARRTAFVGAFQSVLDFLYPIVPQESNHRRDDADDE